jgi:hypothetical protein
MNNELATRPALDQTIEKALIQGDLKDLTPEGRISFYNALCNSLGLNPLTQPFQYITLNGKLQLYAKKDCTEQLRKVHGVSITSVDPKQIGELLVVVAAAKDRDGRVDSSTGAVSIGNLKGENLANAMMKAETKAKRRVTLSLCGLGMLDETEIQTLKEQGVASEPQGNNWPDQQNSSEPDLPSENISQPSASPQTKTTAQPPSGQPAAAPAASQSRVGPTKRIPPSPPDNLPGLLCTVKKIEEAPKKGKVNARIRVTLAAALDGSNQGVKWVCQYATCWHEHLFDAVRASVGKELMFAIKESDKKLNNSDEFPTHFLAIEDVWAIDGQLYSEGKPVVEAK